MTREEFDHLVGRIEAGIGRDHPALRRKVVGLAILGYAGLLSWFIVVVLIAAAFFTAMFWADVQGKIVCAILGLVVLILGGWVSLRLLLARVPPPLGCVIEQEDAPVLFEMLNRLQTQLGSSAFQDVLLTMEFNAGIVQSPRLGALGWSRNQLILGLPLLDALSPDEMHAVLAHEFAHLSRKDGRLSHWLYRLRRSWEISFQGLTDPRQNTSILRPFAVKFVDWFWPRFNAHAFVLSRADEYHADAQAARLVGTTHIASALVRLKIVSRLLEQKTWPDIWELARTLPAPPSDVAVRVHESLRTGADEKDRARWTAEAFSAASTNNDTHPCLHERLSALGASPAVADAPFAAAHTTAAEVLLGPSLDRLRQEVQRHWEKEIAARWLETHNRSTVFSDRLTSMQQASVETAANVERLWDRAHAYLNLRNHTAAQSLLREIVLRQPDHAAANFQIGRLLLEAGNAEGEAHLERAMAANEDWVHDACGLLENHYRALGRTDRLRELSTRLDRHEKALVASRAERATVSANDTFSPHGLADTELEKLRATLAAEPQLQSAELAQKELRYFSRQRLFVLCVRSRRPWYRLLDDSADHALARRIAQQVKLPGRLFVFTPSGSFRALSRKFKKSVAPIWPKSQ